VVDPPYEELGEFDRLARAIVANHRSWPGGRWLIWYPIKDRTPVWRLEEALLGANLPNLLSVELLIRPADGIDLAGSGLILVEPPYGLDARLAALLPDLTGALAPERGSHALRWLART
jgi:23S rRNA (adenine2030-N6)-methyltransferase